MDTFFFIEIATENKQLRLGPYATYAAAAEILMDCLPAILAAELQWTAPETYTATLAEWTVSPGHWSLVAVKATEVRE